MKKLNMGVIGCGDIAGYTALLARLVPRLRLAACCDVDPGRVQSFARRYRIPFSTEDAETLMQHPDLDAVYLAVPHDLHYPMILRAVEAGKAVLVEKPLTRTLEEARQLLPLIAGSKVGVNYQYRYDRGGYRMAQAARSGLLGKIHSVRINVPWHRTQDYFSGAPWHASIARSGGGTLITQGSHFLDLALWALGDTPAAASGWIGSPGFDVEVETLAHGIIETAGGTVISISSSMIAAREGAVTIELYGELGTAVYCDKPLPHVRFTGVRPPRAALPVPGVHALQRSLAAFTRWVLDDIPYLTPAGEALPVLAAVDAVYRATRRV